jgi:hypothetical protein
VSAQLLVLLIVLSPAVVGLAVAVRDTYRARRHPSWGGRR